MARILIIDDQLSLVTPHANALRAAGHEVELAETLEEAVACELAAPFDAFLVDIVLTISDLPLELKPIMDELGSFPTNGGQAFVRWAHERNPSLQHLYITGSTSSYQQAAEFDRAPASQRVLVRGTEEASPDGIVETFHKRLGI